MMPVALKEAARHGHLEQLEVLLKDNPGLVFSKDEGGLTPLHYAAYYGRKGAVELLLANHADVNAKTEADKTPLHDAAFNGHRDVVELLIANNADVNADAPFGSGTPLHEAAQTGHRDVAEVLLGKGARVNAKNFNRQTPLHIAAHFGQKDVAELLVANKADVNARDEFGATPLDEASVAASRGHRDVLELLRGGEPKARCEANSIKSVRVLVGGDFVASFRDAVLVPPDALFPEFDKELAGKRMIQPGELIAYIEQNGYGEVARVGRMTDSVSQAYCAQLFPDGKWVSSCASSANYTYTVVVALKGK